MKKLSVMLTMVLGLCVGSAYAMPSMSKHADQQVACTSCHGSDMAAKPTKETCLQCHGSYEDLAKKTEKFNYVSRMKNPKTGEVKEHVARVNPHDSYHFGMDLSCNECHSEHKASRNDCSTCHDTKAWKIPDLK